MTRYATLILVLLSSGYGNAALAADTGNVAGHAVFTAWCAGCHADNPFAPGTVALRATRGAAAAVLEQRSDLSAVLIETMVRGGYGGMPSFRRTEIGADELDALVAYLRAPGAAKVGE